MLPTLRSSLFWALRSRPGCPLSLPLFPSTLSSRLQSASGATIWTASAMNTELELEIRPYTYTSGRWLRRNKLETESRSIQFSFVALCQKVIELCPEASELKACRKIEGGFNRVFIFTLDNEKNIVARLPFRLAGPAKLTTISEVATIRYLQTKTNIPVPRILDYNCDASDETNIIGSEYIIMEHARGVPLHEKWHKMAGDQQVRCIDAIYRTIKDIAELEFPAFGSIYFDDTLESVSKQPLGDGFCVGPHCGTRYWDTNVGERRYYHDANRNVGPWLTIGDYCDGLVDAGLSQVPPVDTEPERPIYHGSPETHLALLKRTRPVLKQMAASIRVRNSAPPLLFHPDLHTRNIFVSDDNPSVITSIIDWQAASIEPAFWYSDEVPDFAEGSEICAKAFDLSSQFLTPKLAGPRLMNDNIFRPFRYCYRTWKDGAVALRHEMIETARHWNELGFEGQCPYPLPTREELEKHEKEYRLFEAAQNLRTDLSSFLNTASDGWVPPNGWEAAQSAQNELFDGMLQAVLTNADLDNDEPVRDEMTLRSIWPFDLDK
ncbi:kinase-like domain-containing protein [Aspergillus pseudodeflectus]|uniref:Altered inheritance of mitochondria protein 9, mitochondrial n=1 Tax=Aspergillus pseudodeflectus TaxID=176178 RepID=A0ABR4JIC2_9EURO